MAALFLGTQVACVRASKVMPRLLLLALLAPLRAGHAQLDDDAPPPPLPAAIRAFYTLHGFVSVPALLTPIEVSEINLAIDAILQNETSSLSDYHPSKSERALLLSKFVTDDDYARVDRREDLAFHFDESPVAGGAPVLRSINNLIYSTVGARLARDKRIVDVVEAALGDDALGGAGVPLVRFFNSRVFAKPAGGAGTAWHRDIRFFNMVDNGGKEKEGVRTAINALLLLDEQTPRNGALRLVPGSHRNHSRRGRLNLIEEFGDAFAAAQRAADGGSADAPELPGEMALVGLPVGTLVLVDHYTIHGSGANVAAAADPKSQRRMISLGYAGPHIATLVPGDPTPHVARNIAVRGAREKGEVEDYHRPLEWSKEDDATPGGKEEL